MPSWPLPGLIPTFTGDVYTDAERIAETRRLNKRFFDALNYAEPLPNTQSGQNYNKAPIFTTTSPNPVLDQFDPRFVYSPPQRNPTTTTLLPLSFQIASDTKNSNRDTAPEASRVQFPLRTLSRKIKPFKPNYADEMNYDSDEAIYEEMPFFENFFRRMFLRKFFRS